MSRNELYSVRKADYRIVLTNPDPKKLFGQIESGRYRGLNADVQAEAQERGEVGRGVYTVQTLSSNNLDNPYFALTYTL